MDPTKKTALIATIVGIVLTAAAALIPQSVKGPVCAAMCSQPQAQPSANP